MISANLKTAIGRQTYTAFTAIKIILPTYTIRLLNTAGVVAFDINGVTETFEGSDGVFGTIASIGDISESMASESPRLAIGLNMPSTDALAYLTQLSIQTSPVMVYEGSVDRTTGAVEGVSQVFIGMIDQPTLQAGPGMLTVELDCCTSAELYNVVNEAAVLSNAWLSYHFPGSLGLAFNIEAQDRPPWGVEGVRGGSLGSSGYGGGSGGGGGGGGGQYYDLNVY